MKIEGGCYCKEVRYESDGEIGMRAQCFCRECQYITGGDSVLIIGVPEEGFSSHEGRAQGVQAQRHRERRHARVLPELRHSHDDPRDAGDGDDQDRDARRPLHLRRAADGDLHL